MITVKRVAYADADTKEINRWIEHIVEKVLLNELNGSETLKLVLEMSKYRNIKDGLENEDEQESNSLCQS